MTSEKTYIQRNRPDLAALELRADKSSEVASIDRNWPVRPARHSASDPERKQYRAKGALRALELMGMADEEEI